MAFTAVAALATGGGAAALGISVFTAMSYVGIAMAVVGAVTKDKQLLKTGGLMSLMGGVGGAIEGATASTAASTTADTAASGVAAETQAAEAAMGATSSPAAAAAQAVPAAPVQAPPTDLLQAGADGGVMSAAPAVPAPAVQTVAPVVSKATPSTIMPAGGSETLAGLKTPSTYYPGELKIPADDFFGKVGGVWDGLGGEGKAAAIQMVGGAMSGANQAAMWNEKMAMENRAIDLRSYGNDVAQYRKSGIVNTAKA